MNNDKDLDRVDGEIIPEDKSGQNDNTDMPLKHSDADLQDASTEKKPNGIFFKILSSVYDYVEIFAVSVIAVLIAFTFFFRLCRVDGHSMDKTLSHGEMLITSDLFYTPERGDIVVFHLSNESYREPLVKRVIATEGELVEINLTDAVIKVDGVVYEDSFAYLDSGKYDLRADLNRNYMYESNGKLYFSATVPKGKIFVLGDNRNNSSDSRTAMVGFVDVDCVLGKAIIRVSPFTLLDHD